MHAEGRRHVSEVAAVSGNIASGSLEAASNGPSLFEFLFFPELAELFVEADIALLVLGLGIAALLLVFVPGAFVIGALMAWAARVRLRHLA